MSQKANPTMAIVLDAGQVQDVILEHWPSTDLLPQVLVVDYDTEGCPDHGRTRFKVGAEVSEAACKLIDPRLSESHGDWLVPSTVIKAMHETDEARKLSPRQHGRKLMREILEMDRELEAAERSPDGSDYNDLYALVTHGLRNLRIALGDDPDLTRDQN